MEIKHTPGPWKVVACNENFEIQTKDDKCLADAWSYAINSNGEVMEANAKLFAAAPDLLEALQAARDLWGDYLPPGNSNAMKAMKLVNYAIAKATTT